MAAGSFACAANSWARAAAAIKVLPAPEAPNRTAWLAAELGRAEAQLALAQAQFEALQDPDLYRRNQVRFAETTEALDAARHALEAAEEQWLELEMRREELGG